MRRLVAATAIAALLLGLGATDASAQTSKASWSSFMGTLPQLPGVTPTDYAPAMRSATPYGVQFSKILASGSAKIWPPLGDYALGPPSKAWPSWMPDGTAVSCPGTTSNCAQETLNAMLTKGSTDIYGGGGLTGSNAVTAFTGTFNIPLLRNAYVHLHGGGLFQIGTPLAGTPSVTIDSMVEGAIVCEGCQIAGAVGTATGAMPAILLDPHSVLPIEGFTAIAASRLDLGNVSVQWNSGQSDSCVKASLAHGGITRNFIDATEINGGGPSPTTTGCQYGYEVTDAPGGGSPNAYVQNLHRFAFVHLFSGVGILDGLNTTDGAAVIQNIYDVGGIEPRGASSVGAVAFGHGSVFRIGGVDNISGAVQTCAGTGSGASDNHINTGCWANGSTILTGINFVSGSSNNTGWIRPVATNGGTITHLAQDGGTNNVIWRGATGYSKDGFKIVTIDAAGTETGGAILTGTGATVPLMQGTTAGGGKKALCIDDTTGQFYKSTTAAC